MSDPHTLPLVWLLLHTFVAAALVWSCICRFAHTSKTNTIRHIRWAFTGLGIYGGMALFGPFATEWQPDLFHVIAITAITGVQITTSVYWSHGVPLHFRAEAGPTDWPWANGESSTLPPLRNPETKDHRA